MSGITDPGGTMDFNTCKSGAGHQGSTRVDPYTHFQADLDCPILTVKCPLNLSSCVNGISRIIIGHEESISCRIDLSAAISPHGSPDDSSMSFENLRVPVTELLSQSC